MQKKFRIGKIGAFMLGAGASLAASSAGAQPVVGPWPTATPTNVAVLGSPHLSGIQHLRADWVASLLDRLAAWKPQLITIEALSGPECYLLRQYEKNWQDTANSYCRRVESLSALARRSLALDMADAEAEAEKVVATLNSSSSAAERRRMAALFAAAGNLGSAATQWLRIPASERRGDEVVSDDLAAALGELSVMRNENYWIGAALAARLGLERIYPTDDHLSDRIQAEAPPGLGPALRQIWSGPRPAERVQAEAMEKGLGGAPDVLDYYRFLNRPGVSEAYVKADMGTAFITPSEGQHGRRYVGWWEARNLRMVGNIRAALARQPGNRALVIVGATHKPYFDTYLAMMHEVRVVPTNDILGR